MRVVTSVRCIVSHSSRAVRPVLLRRPCPLPLLRVKCFQKAWGSKVRRLGYVASALCRFRDTIYVWVTGHSWRINTFDIVCVPPRDLTPGGETQGKRSKAENWGPGRGRVALDRRALVCWVRRRAAHPLGFASAFSVDVQLLWEYDTRR